MKKICVSALKQSGRYWLPKIHEPSSFSDFINLSFSENKYIAHCKNQTKTPLSSLADATSPQLILIGPEGDFTIEEIELALKNNFKPVDLGTNRLRTETACLVAITLMKNNER
jgi:16S rRNA (uracil1498-N3)-methyltransferase